MTGKEYLCISMKTKPVILLLTVLSALSFGSCTSEPLAVPFMESEDDSAPSSSIAKSLPYSEPLIMGFRSFSTDGVTVGDTGVPVWLHNKQYGIVASAKVSENDYKVESWLFSALIDLSQAAAPELTFMHSIDNYYNDKSVQEGATIWIREENGEWKQLTVNYPSMSTTDYSGVCIDLAAWRGKKVQFGFKYSSLSGKAGTWRVKYFTVAEERSKPGPNPNPNPNPNPDPAPAHFN